MVFIGFYVHQNEKINQNLKLQSFHDTKVSPTPLFDNVVQEGAKIYVRKFTLHDILS